MTELRRHDGQQLVGSAPAEVVPVRLDPMLRAALERRAETERTNHPDFI